jgi:hypothetical protein
LDQPRREATGAGGEDQSVPLGQGGGRSPRLGARALLGHDELAAGEVDSGLVEADDDLEGEEHLAEHVAVQGVPVARPVTQQDLGGLG